MFFTKCPMNSDKSRKFMNAKIELKSMKFYAHHGVFPQETKVGNLFIIDLVLTADIQAAIETDDLNDTINYADVYHLVKQEMDKPSKLLEHVAGRIIRTLKSHFYQIQHVSIRLAKLNPPFGGDVYSAAVILEE